LGLLLFLCAGGLGILPAVHPRAFAAQAPNTLPLHPKVSRAWIFVVGERLHVAVTDPFGRVQSTDDTSKTIPNFSMDSSPIHDRPGVPIIYGTHMVLEPDTGRYVIRVVSPESRTIHLVTRRWLMADCGASDSMKVAAHDTASWSIEYSPAESSNTGPCWIHIRRLSAPMHHKTTKGS